MKSFVKSVSLFLGLWLLVVGLLRYQHRGALADRVLGLEVANGSVAESVRELAAEPSLGRMLSRTVSLDRESGRFRPLFYGYMSLSFVCNAFRYSVEPPGHVFRHLSAYVNGELVGHTRFQLTVLAFAIACLSVLVGYLTRSPGMAAVCAIACTSSVSIGENLLQSYADSQEILVTALVGAYLLFFGVADNEKRFRWPALLGLSALAALTCAAKETAVVLGVSVAGLALVLSGWRLSQRAHRQRLRSSLVLALGQAAVWCALLGLVFLHLHRLANASADPYAGRYQGLSSIACASGARALWRCLSFDPWLRWAYWPSLGAIALLLVAYGRRVLVFDALHRHLATMLLLLVAGGLGFFLVYVPWPDHLMKYMLTAEVLMITGITLTYWVVTAPLRSTGWRHAGRAACLVAGVAAVASYAHAARMNREFYGRYYDCRRVHEAICTDLHAKGSGATRRLTVLVEGLPLAGDFMMWDRVQLSRMLNYRYGWTIVRDGEPLGVTRMDGVNLVLNRAAGAVEVDLDLQRSAERSYDVEYRVQKRQDGDPDEVVGPTRDAGREVAVRLVGDSTIRITRRTDRG